MGMIESVISTSVKWLNENQGVLSVGLFVITIVLGWVSGIFTALQHKPRFRIKLLDGPTFCCTFPTGQTHGEYDVHRTGIALYLHVANSGSAPSSVEEVHVGYHWHLKPLSRQWLKYRLGWFWLQHQAVALSDFRVGIGDHVKFYPFLFQRSTISGESSETYLQVGQYTKGVVYFEQNDSFGGCFPSPRNGRVRIKVRITDPFGTVHTAKFYIPSVDVEYARKYNPKFGQTFAQLRGAPLPFDVQDTELASKPDATA